MGKAQIRESGSEAFTSAAAQVKDLKSKPSDTELLELYALFKQALFGDATDEDKPTGMFDFKGKAKFAEWEKQKGKTPEEADAEYVAKVAELVKQYGVN